MFIPDLTQIINDKKFQKLCEYYRIKIDFSMCEFDDNCYSINFKINNKDRYIYSWYSPYYNATIFSNDNGDIDFIVLHDKGEMYIYYDSVSYPEHDEPEIEEQWIDDMKNGYCEKVKLSKRNILKAFKLIFNNNQSAS